ncbi:C40 family peptidase [Streptomyces sp. TLI_171]|uniref:C40 family peptidase n=1 Tax=Streptomyces sp. TLI_171 TaxID=1938859 RepID=UPI000C3E96B8|nr:C40 family peptidase [Streptomyces sp. TLI_171]RKE23024.1 NlpC/P60 family protein [Streptomyces sp. TLI_171]
MSRGAIRSWRAAALLLATLLLLPAVPADADPAPVPAGELTIDQLSRAVEDARHVAEAAEQRYTGAAEQLAERERASAAAAAEADRERGRAAEAEAAAARVVGEQYRSGGLGPVARLVLADRPEEFLDRQLQATRRARTAADVLRDLREARNRLVLRSELALQARQSAADAARDAQQALDRARAAEARTEQLLASASAEQLGLLERRESALAERVGEQLPRTGAFGPGGGPSAAGRRAIGFALAQRGKPYRWGGTGPDAFDCSGLTSRAWQAAGTGIPRTSQAQWAALHRVALRDLRPGDLVIYHADAGHVALYVGGGTVVHAPHTGAVVELAPLTMLPVLGAVRPDPDAPADG